MCLLVYADDMVLLSDSENGLQNMLNTMFDWCQDNAMAVNTNKTNIVHFRPPSIDRTQYEFHCGDAQLTVVEKYTYLDLILTTPYIRLVKFQLVRQIPDVYVSACVLVAKLFLLFCLV